MFGAHMPELIIILVVALVIFGPKRLPEIGSGMGRAIRNFKKGVDDIGAPEETQQISAEPVAAESVSPQA